MVVEVSAWLQLILWGNLLIMMMALVSLEGIRRERKQMQRMIIALAETRRRR